MTITKDKQREISNGADRDHTAPIPAVATEKVPAAAAGAPVTATELAVSATVSGPEKPVNPLPRTWHWRKLVAVVGTAAGLAIAGYFLVPWLRTLMSTESTDDAYVNGHVTYIAPRVAGQVQRVLVDDNNRVCKGDLLAQLDPEPYQVQVNAARAAVKSAEADLVAATAEARGVASRTRSLRFAMEHAIEDVHNQVALIAAKVAALNSQRAVLENAQHEYERVKSVREKGAAAEQELFDRAESLHVAEAKVEEALQSIYQVRVGLGLPPKPENSDDLTQVPEDLDEHHSSVRQAQASLVQSAVQLGITGSFEMAPRQMMAEFVKRDPDGDLDRIFEKLIAGAPGVRQAESRLEQARRNLDEAELNLRYCDVIAEIDGVVTRRAVNPGNHVVAGQNIMAVRSVTEIWIDANFKETQLGVLRIGQRVACEVDMYGGRREFEGRITGFTMGTGQTLDLLPPQNATGNFVKIVQRLPVRIELTHYDPHEAPLFVGLSVAPRVYYKEPPSGPHAGEMLQPVTECAARTAARPASTQVASTTARSNEP